MYLQSGYFTAMKKLRFSAGTPLWLVNTNDTSKGEGVWLIFILFT